MRPKDISFTMAILDRNGISAAETLAGAGNFTIGGALATGGVATMDVARHIAVYAFTITGTDRNGHTITEDITGVNASTVNGSKNFKTVTQVAGDAATAGDVEIGTTDEADTQIVPVESYIDKLSYSITLSASASLTYEFKYTLEDIFAQGFLESDILDADWFTDLGPQVANTSSRADGVVRAVRLEVTNWTSASDVITWNIVQKRVR